MTTPSCHNMPIFRDWEPEMCIGFQGRGMRAGSISQGLTSRIVFMKSWMPSRLVLMGPMTPGIGSVPAMVEHHPSVGIRKAVGLKP